MNFNKWWFDKGGEQIAFDKYGDKITEKDIKRQPSFKIFKNRENAITEAVWEKAQKDWKKGKLKSVV